MTRYNIAFKYSNNGTAWSQTSTFVNATSESDAKNQVKRKYANAKDLKIVGKKTV